MLAAAARPALRRAVAGGAGGEEQAGHDVLPAPPGAGDALEDTVDKLQKGDRGFQERFHGLPPRGSSLAGAPGDGLRGGKGASGGGGDGWGRGWTLR